MLFHMYKYIELTNNIFGGTTRENINVLDEINRPRDTNFLNKIMTWYGVDKKTIKNKSDSKIALVLLEGTNKVII